MRKNPLYPKMIAVIGDDPRNIAAHSGRRAYFPFVITKKTPSYPYTGKFTVNASGCNGCRQEGEDGLQPFDRLALLLAAAPELYAALDDLVQKLSKPAKPGLRKGFAYSVNLTAARRALKRVTRG